MIKLFRILAVVREVGYFDSEFALFASTLRTTVSNRIMSRTPAFFTRPFDIVEQHRARRVRGNLFAEMFLERVIRKFQTLFRPIRPQVAIHGTMHRFPVFIEPRAPRVVPQTAPVGLLFKAHNFRHFSAFFCRGLKGSQLCKPEGPAPMMATRLVIVTPYLAVDVKWTCVSVQRRPP